MYLHGEVELEDLSSLSKDLYFKSKKKKVLKKKNNNKNKKKKYSEHSLPSLGKDILWILRAPGTCRLLGNAV